MSKFYDEMRQQSEVLQKLLDCYHDDYRPVVELTDIIKERNLSEFVFIGMGSSYFVGYIACAILNKNGIKAKAYEAKEFSSYAIHTIQDDTLIFLISQSGDSEEVLELSKKFPTDHNIITVTNNNDRPLYHRGEIKFLLYAGEELATATKSYTNTVAAILKIANVISACFGKETFDFDKLVRASISEMKSILEEDSSVIVDLFKDAEYICLVGGGASYCTASHLELVVEEAGKMYATRYLPAQFLHGPVELINKGFNVIASDFSENYRVEIDRIIDNVLTFGGKICVLTNRDITISNPNFLSVKLNIDNEFYAPLLEVIPIELFIYKLGVQRGINPGHIVRVKK